MIWVDWKQYKKNLEMERKAWEEYATKKKILDQKLKEQIRRLEIKKEIAIARIEKEHEKKLEKLKKKHFRELKKAYTKYRRITERKFKPSVRV